MDKFCVFCGKIPKSKNREHVVPAWLLRLTGDPNREVYLGLKWNEDLSMRTFAFSSFTFPACKQCNDTFSQLEDAAKKVVEKILAHMPLGVSEIDILLDWLDKLRIGLWLGSLYLNKNYRDIVPNFHISDRMGSKDRSVAIYEVVDDGKKGVRWGGSESPLFQHLPACFVLEINNFVFFNASADFLFSERIGFPYPSRRKYNKERCMEIEMTHGSGKIELPLIDCQFKDGGTLLFQPIIPYGHFTPVITPEIRSYYHDAFVRDNCINFANGKGTVFRCHSQSICPYPQTPSLEWLPPQVSPRGEAFHQVTVSAGEFLGHLYEDVLSLDFDSDEEKNEIEQQVRSTLEVHAVVLDHFRNQKDMYY